jgi:hypothetical protein
MRERITFEREMKDLRGATFAARVIEGETFGGLRKRLPHLSLFPHWTGGGTAVRMSPAVMDPGSRARRRRSYLPPRTQRQILFAVNVS